MATREALVDSTLPPASVLGYFRSTVGKKLVMAATGVVLFGFVVVHMAGNLLVYKGPEALNAYSEGLRHFPALLWGARIVLLVAVSLHIWASTTLTLGNWAARPKGYRLTESVASNYASRTMKWSGPILLLFIVYHLLHFTFGTVHPSFVPGDVYHNFVTGFQVPWVSGFYIVALLCLGLHMYHGVWSMFQSVGLAHPRYNKARKALALIVTVVVVGADISFPVAVLTGFLR